MKFTTSLSAMLESKISSCRTIFTARQHSLLCRAL